MHDRPLIHPRGTWTTRTCHFPTHKHAHTITLLSAVAPMKCLKYHRPNNSYSLAALLALASLSPLLVHDSNEMFMSGLALSDDHKLLDMNI